MGGGHHAITRVRSMFRAYPSPMGIIITTRVQAYLRYRTGSKLLASWPYLCSLAGQTLSPLRVCPARLVQVRVASWLSGQLAVRATARN